jgi:hypothetical protein
LRSKGIDKSRLISQDRQDFRCLGRVEVTHQYRMTRPTVLPHDLTNPLNPAFVAV